MLNPGFIGPELRCSGWCSLKPSLVFGLEMFSRLAEGPRRAPKFRAHITKVAAALQLILQALGMLEAPLRRGTAQEFCCSMAAAP